MGRKHVGSADLAEWVRRQKETSEEEKRTLADERLKREKDQGRLKREESREQEVSSPMSHLLPEGVYAHFLLIDIAPPIKHVRGLPQYLQINQAKTLIGSYVNAHIRLDDPDTVEIKHAKLVYEEKNGKREFVIYPIDQARLSVNGEAVSSHGTVLKSGDKVKIGSADLIIFHKDLRED